MRLDPTLLPTTAERLTRADATASGSRQEMTAGTTPTNDVGHLTLAALTVLLIVGTVGVGAAALGKWFRIYSILTLTVVLACGGLTGRLSAGITGGEATPWLGLVERTSIGAWLVWLAVLAITLLREQRRTEQVPPGAPSRR